MITYVRRKWWSIRQWSTTTIRLNSRQLIESCRCWKRSAMSTWPIRCPVPAVAEHFWRPVTWTIVPANDPRWAVDVRFDSAEAGHCHRTGDSRWPERCWTIVRGPWSRPAFPAIVAPTVAFVAERVRVDFWLNMWTHPNRTGRRLRWAKVSDRPSSSIDRTAIDSEQRAACRRARRCRDAESDRTVTAVPFPDLDVDDDDDVWAWKALISTDRPKRTNDRWPLSDRIEVVADL